MSDVRLVATNPDDNTLVPVASNSSGQLAVQSPKIEKVPNDFDVEGDLTVSGIGTFADRVSTDSYYTVNRDITPGSGALYLGFTQGVEKFKVGTDGSAEFMGDVVVFSRNNQWMLVEQGGLCHMVAQTKISTADLVDPGSVDPAFTVYPKLRDVFAELDLLEQALKQVMEKLKMVEPDGWPVWDGSDNS